ncbi:glutaredoxin family protein [Herminiimonas sp. CN]|uniref:glutaredoxin family protein n=1 Tax=Herminiimonas sp. CN TaxID=1349818 RepID=UPI00047341F3|nr:glutaredoxin family protein [Herminiimonas sp. CN]
MKRTGLLLAGWLALSGAGAAQAQLYKWVDAGGKITYSDLPPPKTALQLDTLKPSGASTAALPYALAEASKNHPVTLFTGLQCAPCAEAREFLKNRGIPFAEKSVTGNDDIAKLRQVSGDTQLPVLLVGRNKQLGFESGAWNTALSAAGYPTDNQLPANFRFVPAEPAAPKAPTRAERPAISDHHTAPAATPAQRLPASGNAPPGFRF